MSRPAYLGFPVQVLGREGQKLHDARRWQSESHLRVSLGYLRELFTYLDETDIRLYRMASGLAPYATHPDHPQFHGQVDARARELAELGAKARQLGLRLVHFSSPRTDWGFRYGSEEKSRAPNWSSHAEFADSSAFIAFYRAIVDPAPDVILKAKAKDVAVLQLRRDLVRYAPDLAAEFGLEVAR